MHTGVSEDAPAALVPTGTSPHSYACIRSLHRQGVQTVVASEREWVPQFASRYCSERVRLDAPPAEVSAYKEALLAVAERPSVEAVVPVREHDAYVLARYADEFAEVVGFVAPDMATLERGQDRLELAAAADSAGVPVAETRALSAVEDWDGDQVVKSRYNLLTPSYTDSVSPGRAEEVRSVCFLPAGVRPDVAALRARMRHDPIVQEYVPESDRVCYSGLWVDGEPVSTYQHRQVRGNSWVGGGGVYRESVHVPAVESVATDLLSELDWHGFACVEYLEDARTGEWKFVEINPRTWQSLPEAVRAGVDFPLHYWRRARGDTGPVDDTYATGVGCHLSYGEVTHLLSVFRDESPFAEPPSFARRLREVVTSCVTEPRFDYLRADDPRWVVAAVRAGLSGDGDGDDGESGSRYGTVDPDVAEGDGGQSPSRPTASDGGRDR